MKQSAERIRCRQALLSRTVSTAAVQRALSTPVPQETRYRSWSPLHSSTDIQYSDELLHQVLLTSLLGDASGVLYGSYLGLQTRVVAARRDLVNGAVESDPRLAGLVPVGVFFARVRGQVFLTEHDLNRFERSDGALALVVAGTKAGFFVYEADGSIETIKSLKEFTVPRGPSLARFVKPADSRAEFKNDRRRLGGWLWLGFVTSLVFAAVFLTQSHWLPPPAMWLTANEQSGQLRIRWSQAAAKTTATTLEIADGNTRISLPLSSALASITYVRRTSDVQIHFTAGGHVEAVHFFGAGIPPARIQLVRQQLSQLELETQSLETDLERGAHRISLLQSAIHAVISGGARSPASKPVLRRALPGAQTRGHQQKAHQ